MIDLQSIRKLYGDGASVALDGLSLRVETGETLALRGPSGAGKTSLLNLIGAIDTPTSGSVCIDGKDIAAVDNLSGFRARSVGLVFQFHYLLPHLTALENVILPLYPTLRGRRNRRAQALSLLQSVGIDGKQDRLPGALSGGERQLVAVARSLANRPPILLADEPTGSLDAASGERVIELLLDYCRGNGATLIVATHNDAVAARMARQVVLEFGRIKAT